MHSHPNARLTQKGRLRLVTQHLEHGRNLAELAAESGISLRCAYRWLPRYLAIYNRLRKHSALGYRSPQQRLNELLA
jgi:hypothetical protein